MGNSPWTRENWNSLIRRVNALSQNPDSGCDPKDPLAEVGPDHRWTKADIEEVQNRLQEICEENQFTSPNLWKQQIVDEINDAITKGWCGCEDEECLDMCPNAAPPAELYLGSWAAVYLHVGDIHYDCSGHSEDYGDLWEKCNEVASPNYTSAEASQYQAYISDAGRQAQEWAVSAARVCMYKGQLRRQQDMLADAKRDLAGAEKRVGLYCVPNGNHGECADAKDAVQSLTQQIADLEKGIAAAQQQLVEEEKTRDQAAEAADAAVSASWALGGSFGLNKPELSINFVQFYQSVTEPWNKFYSCDNANDAPSRCRTSFSIMAYDAYTGKWHSAANGSFTPNGLAYSDSVTKGLPWCGTYTEYHEGCPGWPPFYGPTPPRQYEKFCQCSGLTCVGCQEHTLPPVELKFVVHYPEPVRPPCPETDGNEGRGE
jgi:hypothetical protein